jgi:Fe-S-cluster containining protein
MPGATPHEELRADEGPFECRSCGVCCHDASDGHVLVSAEDLVRWKREARTDILERLVPGHFSQLGFAARPSGQCIHQGTAENANDCSIYATRAEPCRAVQAGSQECRMHRRAFRHLLARD